MKIIKLTFHTGNNKYKSIFTKINAGEDRQVVIREMEAQLNYYGANGVLGSNVHRTVDAPAMVKVRVAPRQFMMEAW